MFPSGRYVGLPSLMKVRSFKSRAEELVERMVLEAMKFQYSPD